MTLYRTVTSVPLIIRYPDVFPPGIKVPTPVQNLDIYPTLVKLINPSDERFISELQGKPLTHSFHGETHPFLISELFRPALSIEKWKKRMPDADPGEITVFHRRIKSIELGDYKFIRYSDGTLELFHVGNDPGETENILEDHPEIVADMNEKLQKWLQSFPHKAVGTKKDDLRDLDAEVRDNLRVLGYLQ